MREIAGIITGELADLIQPVINKIAMVQIGSTVAITTAQKADVLPSSDVIIFGLELSQLGLIVSLCVGVLIGLDKIINIGFLLYDRWKGKE